MGAPMAEFKALCTNMVEQCKDFRRMGNDLVASPFRYG